MATANASQETMGPDQTPFSLLDAMVEATRTRECNRGCHVPDGRRWPPSQMHVEESKIEERREWNVDGDGEDDDVGCRAQRWSQGAMALTVFPSLAQLSFNVSPHHTQLSQGPVTPVTPSLRHSVTPSPPHSVTPSLRHPVTPHISFSAITRLPALPFAEEAMRCPRPRPPLPINSSVITNLLSHTAQLQSMASFNLPTVSFYGSSSHPQTEAEAEALGSPGLPWAPLGSPG
ncbi:uncharacterized protein IWZ02DRAFT_436460 [Phyllosticta citriasiana]|uniref:uncharacterized protein n=1 Tax=Phyllosticta citriasiana TaxID=595635 RepID=UPI0030FD7BE9